MSATQLSAQPVNFERRLAERSRKVSVARSAAHLSAAHPCSVDSPMHIEAMRGRHKLIHILLESPVYFNCQTIPRHPRDPSYFGKNTILHIACGNGDIELVKLIFSHFID